MKNSIMIAATLFVFTTIVSAHAFLDRSQPKVGEKLASSPQEVKIWFNQEIEPAFSAISVYDADDKQVDKKDSHADPDDKKLLIVSLPSLFPGKYKVVWHVVSTDTHRTTGDFAFTIK